MKPFFLFILICFSLVLAVSCASKKPSDPVIVESTRTIREVVKDTIFKVESDSSFYKAYVECRNGKPVIVKDSIIEKSGKTVLVPKVILKNNYLKVDCNKKAQQLFAGWKETYIQEQKPLIVEKPVYKEKPFRWCHKALMWLGGIFLFIVGLAIFLKLTKRI